jgi:hypothetical protein
MENYRNLNKSIGTLNIYKGGLIVTLRSIGYYPNLINYKGRSTGNLKLKNIYKGKPIGTLKVKDS